MMPKDTLVISAQNTNLRMRISSRLSQGTVKLGVQLQSNRFAQLTSHAMAMSDVQQNLSVAVAIIVILGQRQAKHMLAHMHAGR